MNINKTAREVFKILQTYDYVVQLFDEAGAAVEEVEDARRMYVKSENMLVTIKDDGENSTVTLMIGNNVDINSIEGLIQSLRTACTLKNTLNFGIKRHDGEINLKADISETIRGEHPMNIFEGLYGTSRSSYLKLENARMIIKHSSKIDETKHGARARCIESIFIENANGERMLFPTRGLLPARAMAQHVSMGGGFHDAVAQQIGRMAQDFSNLATCSGHVLNNGEILPEGAQAVREVCKKKMANMRKTFEKMSRPNGYTVEAAKMIEMANALIENEDADKVDPEKIEEVRSTLALEGVTLSDDLIESVCRAMKDEGENELTEDGEGLEGGKSKAARVFSKKLTPENSISVFGIRVRTDAYKQLARGHIQLTHPVSVSGINAEEGVNPLHVMVHKLEQVVPVIADDSLMNLVSFVCNELERYIGGQPLTSPGPLRGVGIHEPTDDPESDEEDTKTFQKAEPIQKAPAFDQARRLKDLRTLARYVLIAAGLEKKPSIPSKVPAVAEYINWFDKLSARSVLVERDLPPRQFMGNNPYDDEHEHEGKLDTAIEHAVRDFNPTEFAETYVEENGFDDDSLEPEERVIDRAELLNAIENHLLFKVSEYEDGDVNPPSDMMSDAEKLLPDVVESLELKGFSVSEVEEEEFDPFSNDAPDDNADLHQMLRSMHHDDGEDDIRDHMGDMFEFVQPKKKRV